MYIYVSKYLGWQQAFASIYMRITNKTIFKWNKQTNWQTVKIVKKKGTEVKTGQTYIIQYSYIDNKLLGPRHLEYVLQKEVCLFSCCRRWLQPSVKNFENDKWIVVFINDKVGQINKHSTAWLLQTLCRFYMSIWVCSILLVLTEREKKRNC